MANGGKWWQHVRSFPTFRWSFREATHFGRRAQFPQELASEVDFEAAVRSQEDIG